MTYAPASLRDLAAYWVAKGGVNLGIVGNQAHCSGYHLGRDRIYSSCACRRAGRCLPGLGDDDYSVQLTRDRLGLTDAASAIDLGRLEGTLKRMRRFCEWLVERCKANEPGTDMIRELIYSTSDGIYVKRWSEPDRKVYTSLRKRPDGSIVVVTPGNGDASHYGHAHASFYRSTEAKPKIGLFAPYFEDTTPPDTGTGDDEMQTFRVPEQRTFVKLPKGTKLYDTSALAGNDDTIILDPGRAFVLVGWYSSAVAIIAYEPPAEDPGDKSRAMYARKGDIVRQWVEMPYTEAQVDAAYNEGVDAVVAAARGVPKR